MQPAIKVRGISKRYQLGLTHAGSVRELVNGAVSKVFGSRRHESAISTVGNDTGPDHIWALRDVSFEVNPGEAIGVIGRNGAGKSTLLKILSRITRPTDGRIELYGRVASLLEVGTGFHPELTGRENVYMNGTILGMTKKEIKNQFDSIVEFAEVQKFVDTPVKRYSSGMTVRLGFAVAAHLNPEILIVDEVLAVGDAEFQKRCLGKMNDIARSGRTVLFVSHNMASIRQLTSTTIVVEDGQLAFHGATDDALDYYLGRFRKQSDVTTSMTNLERVSWAGDQSVRFDSAEFAHIPQGSNDSFKLSLGLRANEINKIRLGLTIWSSDGSPVATGHSKMLEISDIKEIQHFQIHIDNPNLVPGHYWVSMGLLKGLSELVDVVYEVLHFEIPDKAFIESNINIWNTGWGSIQLNVRGAEVIDGT